MANKVYISMPVDGKSPAQINEERERALEEIIMQTGNNVQLANPYYIDMGKGEVWNLGRALQKLDSAVEVFFLPGWEEEPQCRVEKLVCEYYHILHCEVQGDEEQLIIPGGQAHL